MGFLLFTESSVFNPINYGLQAGDNVFVVAVGGGGGAGGLKFYSQQPNNYKTAAIGGAGAPSSFGGYVSAPGGHGGNGGSVSNYGIFAGGSYGQPGWFPWLESHPISADSPKINAWVPQQWLNQALAHVAMGLRGFVFLSQGTDGYNIKAPIQNYVSNISTGATAVVTNVTKDQDEVPWATFSVEMVSSHPSISYRTLAKEIPAAGKGQCYFGPTPGSTYGSIGYGVGGTGQVSPYSSYYPFSTAGTTGSIVKKMIVLEDTSPIAVSVGGGGGSAGFEPVSTTNVSNPKNGNDGSTSAQAPSNGLTLSGAGGYAGVNPTDNSGGGVCGCVAIWF